MLVVTETTVELLAQPSISVSQRALSKSVVQLCTCHSEKQQTTQANPGHQSQTQHNNLQEAVHAAHSDSRVGAVLGIQRKLDLFCSL